MPGAGGAQQSPAAAEPSTLPLQQEALAALRPCPAVRCPTGDTWGQRGGRCRACSSVQGGFVPSLPGLLLPLLKARQGGQGKRGKL